jgi:uncharacterized sulfatase
MTNPKPQNIVLIVLDTHRRDRISAYGEYHRETTPNIDHFAQEAALFSRAISPAQWTIPAHSSIFTGEYPTTHQALQAHAMLDSRFDTLAKLLSANGYQTTGFCNNPLLGVLNNGLKRGFDKFYNYCGAVPSVPDCSNRLPKPLNKFWEWYTQQLRKASYPIQNAFAHSDFLFQLSLHPNIAPLWSKFANFKGHTANSIRDALYFLQKIVTDRKPHFVFLNLMEPHLPYSPPDTFIQKFAPYFRENREGRDFMRRYNADTFRWLLPLEEPLAGLRAALLNDIYDAEVHYQDYLLGPLLEFLNAAENTLTILVADHGEGIGEHGFVGHSFVAYQELVHVPLIVKFSEGLATGRRIAETVSTRRIFHTALAAANVQLYENNYRPATDVKQFSLAQTAQGHDPEQGLVFSEAYPPGIVLSMIRKHAPHLVEKFQCGTNRWGVYEGQYKLVRLEGVKDELFDVAADPTESRDIIQQRPEQAAKLSAKLKSFVAQAVKRRPDTWQVGQTTHPEDDENIRKQLKALGYID